MSGAARITRHGRNHLPGGSDPILSVAGAGVGEVAWEDVGTTTGPRALPYVLVDAQQLAIAGDNTAYFIDFNGANTVGYTNDVSTEADYKTDAGASFTQTGAWSGDYFEAPTTHATSAFRIKTDVAGVYVVVVQVEWRVLGVGGTLYVGVGMASSAPPFLSVVAGSPGAEFPGLPFQANVVMRWEIAVPLLVWADAGSPDTDVMVTLRQASGTASQASTTYVRAGCYRLSPSS